MAGLASGCHLHEPLGRHHRLDDRVAALAVTDRVHVWLAAALETQLLELRLDRLAGSEAIEPGERATRGGYHALFVEDRDHRQAVPLSGLEVVGVVGGRHLDRAGAELGVDQHAVGDDRVSPVRRTGV